MFHTQLYKLWRRLSLHVRLYCTQQYDLHIHDYQGHHGNRQEISNTATSLYGTSLRQLRDAIEDPQRCYDHDNLSATMALYLYEVRVQALRSIDTRTSSDYRLHFECWLS